MDEMLALQPRVAAGGTVSSPAAQCWRLAIPAGPGSQYRLAQVDDYHHLPRDRFLWRPPLRLSLRARVSHVALPGTWGFGLWNDPFGAGLGLGGTARRLPTPPNAAWFFFASPENHLAFREEHPASGFMAATFSAPALHGCLLGAIAPAAPLLLVPPGARALRGAARRLVGDDAGRVPVDPLSWHRYDIVWLQDSVRFCVDGTLCHETHIVPKAPLGLVIWIDNQYMAWKPSDRVRFGTLPCLEPAWLDLSEVTVRHDQNTAN